MQVIIPLAGKGTRMRPHTHTTAKPLLPVAGRPVLAHIFERLAPLDISEYIFITGHLKEQIEQYVRTNLDKPVRFIEQETKDGTAGAIRLAKPYVKEPVLIIFVDTIFDADLSIIAESSDDGIIWAKEVEEYQRFGVIVHDKKGCMTRIVEKPSEPISRLANIGVYYIRSHKKLFEGIEHVYEKNITLKGEYYLTDVFQWMVDQGASIRVAEVAGWYDCGAFNTTIETNRVLLELQEREKKNIQKAKLTQSVIIPPVSIAQGTSIERSVVGPNVSIGAGVVIKASVLTDSIIADDASIEEAMLDASMVGVGARVTGASGSCNIGDHSSFTKR